MTTDSHQLLSDPKMAVKLFGIRKDLHDLNGRTCLHSNGVLALEDDDGKREEGGLPTVDEARAAAVAVFDLAPGESLEDLFHAQLPLYVPEPPLPSFRPQLQWIDPPLSLHVLMVDVHGQKEQAERELAKSYMDIAFHRQLTDQQFQTVAGFFDRDPLFLHDCGLSQDAFLLLVEHNPNLAVGVTLRLVGSTKINDYLKALITAPLTLHTVEVVNRLATETDLPEEFLPLYVSGCIQGCDKVTDPAMQARQVRLVCLFLQSLLRNGAISLADFSVEIEAFCVQFSRIKEAAGLFQLIKQQ
ncbi:hypothetical protein DFJ73DRAFT_367222 [Zopfochytrium polystomum]|nr:hypothetical protein DFJ73DRAFT_367222 [Zopfochytrium polystomum]